MNYYILQPEVPGFGVLRIGSDIVIEIDVPPSDDLLTVDNYFFVSERLHVVINSRMLTGASTRLTKAVISKQRKRFSPDLVLPDYYLLNVHGTPGLDDFVILDYSDLLVSGRALDTLREFKLNNCDISVIDCKS